MNTLQDDYSFLVRANADLRTALEQLEALQSLASQLAAAHNPQDLFDALKTIMPSVLPFSAIQAVFRQPGKIQHPLLEMRLVESWVRQPIPDEAVDWVKARGKPSAYPLEKPGCGVILCPLLFQGNDLGHLALHTDDDFAGFHESAVLALDTITRQVSIALQNLWTQDKLKAEANALGETKEFLDGVIASVESAVFSLDSFGRLLLANQAAETMFGRKLQLCLGMHASHVFPLEVMNAINTLFNALRQEKHTTREAISFRSVDGRTRHAELMASPLRIDQTRGMVIVARDLENTLEIKRLQEIDRLKDDFISVVSHELRTPLSSILAYTEALRDGILSSDEERADAFDTITQEGLRLSNLVNDILDLSKLESGKMSFQMEALSIPVLFKKALGAVKGMADKAQVGIEVQYPDNLEQALGDPRRLVQALVNFLGNSIKFTPSRRKVYLRAHAEGEGILISVEDEGPGIPAHQRSKIFEKFTQLEDVSKHTQGTGLGLAICREIIGRHGSNIDVGARSGGGSIFSFCLPKAASQAANA